MIKHPTFVGEEEIHERERIKKKITSFAIFIKYQNNFIAGKQRMCIICLWYSIGSLGEKTSQKLPSILLLSSFSSLLFSQAHCKGSGEPNIVGTLPFTEERSFCHLPSCWRVQPLFPAPYNSSSRVP